LSGHRGDVPMMVLDADEADPQAVRDPGGVARAEEIRMQIVGNALRLDLQNRNQVLDGVHQGHAGRRVDEIADVLRYERFVAARDAYGVLVMYSQCDHRGTGSEQLDRLGRVAPGAANELKSASRTPGNDAHHAVVAAGDDGAVMHEQD